MDYLPPPEPQPDPERSFSHRLALALLIPLVIVFVGLFITLFVTHSTTQVEGPSMEPTLQTQEIVLVTRGYEKPVRGDVVIVRLELSDEDAGLLVKRIVALAGDEIEVDRGNAIINGSPERGDHTVVVSERDISVPRQVVPEGHVYVLGDNRPLSEDSRLFGPVPAEWLTGKVIAVVAPINSLRFVD